MKSRFVLACLFGATCLALGFGLARTYNPTPANANNAAPDTKGGKAEDEKPISEDEAAIRKSFNAYLAAYAKGDVDAVLAMWANDAEFIDDNGKVFSGHKTLTQLFAKNLPSFKGYKITGKLTSVRFIKPDVAMVDGEQTFTPPKGEPDVSRFTSVWVKTDGKWLIRSARDLTPEGEGESVARRQLRELDWLIGNWVSEGNDLSVHLHVKWALDKAFMVFDYEVKTKQGHSSKVVQWVGWDPTRDQIKSWVFDDQAGYAEALWSRSGNTWTSETVGVLPDGSTGSGLNVLKYQDDNTFIWQSLRREADGQPLPDVDAKFMREVVKP